MRYRAALADENAWKRARRPKRCKLAHQSLVATGGGQQARLNWAPEQIAGWLNRAHPEGERYQVSHETIYRSLFVQARGVLKTQSCFAIFDRRSHESVDRNRRASMAMDGRQSRIPSRSVRDRPRLKIGRCLAVRQCDLQVARVHEQLYRDSGRTSYPLRDVGQGGQ